MPRRQRVAELQREAAERKEAAAEREQVTLAPAAPGLECLPVHPRRPAASAFSAQRRDMRWGVVRRNAKRAK